MKPGERSAGVQLHITSLPGGRLGEEARRFVDWLAAAGQSYWQVLPLGVPDRHGSPYKSRSAFACWPELLEDPDAPVSAPEEREFRTRQSFWIGDWERAAGGRRALHAQVRFQREWLALRRYARERGVSIIGDMPLYVAPGSVDQRAWPELFLDGFVAGAPPDQFTAAGQLWGNPVYNWPAMRRRRYRWWIERMRRAGELFDLVRIDHFRGLVAYWAVPRDSRSAAAGRWRRGPGGAPLVAARAQVRGLRVIAEDLGVITPPVERLRRRLRVPGMAVLQFLFEREKEESSAARSRPAASGSSRSRTRRAHSARQREAPRSDRGSDPLDAVGRDRVLYTGTHDQDTLMGWWTSLDGDRRDWVLRSLHKRAITGEDGPWPLVQLAASAPAAVTMVQMQDLLGLGSEARMNTPGRAAGNWGWRMEAGMADAALARRLRRVCESERRVP